MERPQQLIVPIPGVDVEKHCARCVGFIGHVNLAFGKFPDEPGVNGSKGEFAPLRPFACPGNVLEHPSDFRSGEVSVDHQAGPAIHELFQTIGSHLIANGSGSAVLPNDRMEDWFTCFPVPNHRGFSLVGDSVRGDVPQTDVRTANRV